VRSEEIEAAGNLAAKAAGGPGWLIGEVHQAIAGRPFAALGLLGAPVRFIHDRVAGTVYRAVGGALATPVRAGAGLVARATPVDATPLAGSLRGSMALGALNGAIGDALDREGSELALAMSFRREGREVGPADYEDATPRLAVFVHGLCETDEAWGLSGRPGYGSRLSEELGYTPLYLRYNTGLHISDNGRRLAELLEEVVEEWPTPVEEVVLVGHSMGGLVARGACHYGHAAEAEWARRLRHVFCLGSPHLGAPLEKAANVAGYALSRLPETRPIAKLVNGRSVGIKDLRFGSCVEEDWCDCDADEFMKDRCNEVPFLDCATYYFVGATLAQNPNSLVGDLLVRFPSASGQGRRRRIPFEIDNGVHLGGLNHFQLLNHPAVYEQIHAWLARPKPKALAASA
jgi:pimeloyl-ACP methyl ester carboxylesterase